MFNKICCNSQLSWSPCMRRIWRRPAVWPGVACDSAGAAMVRLLEELLPAAGTLHFPTLRWLCHWEGMMTFFRTICKLDRAMVIARNCSKVVRRYG